MKRILKYLLPYKVMVILAPLLMLIEVVTDIWQPKLMADIVNIGIVNKDLDFIYQKGLFMIFVAIVGIVGGFGCTIAASYASQSFGTDLRRDVFSKVLDFSFVELDKFHTATLITRLTNDITQVQNMVLMALRMMVRAPLLSIGGIIMAVTLNSRLAWILLVSLPVLFTALTYIIRKGFPLFEKVQQKLDNLNNVIRGNLAGIRLIKAYVREDRESQRFKDANEQLKSMTVKASRIMTLNMPIMMLCMNLSILMVLWFGGQQVKQGHMKVGDIIAFTTYMTQILFALTMITFILMAISRAKASADRIAEVLAADVAIKEDENAKDKIETGRVVFDSVSFSYYGKKDGEVLNNISLCLEPGQIVAIMGGTGAGKTSLVNLIPRFYDVTRGSVSIDGTDVRKYKLKTLREAVGMVLQEPILFSGTVMENLRWGNQDATEEQLMEAARLANAHEFINSFPDKYNTLIGQRGVNLSGGQKQRLTIARALVKKPKIVILDDSTSAVDMITEAGIQKAFRENLKDVLTIIIAQRISSVMSADKIILLEQGKVSAVGTHHELLQASEIYKDIYNSQAAVE